MAKQSKSAFLVLMLVGALLLIVSSATPAAAASTCPCGMFGTGVPAVPDGGDATALKLGMVFHTDTYGWVTGIRFYKSAANTGTHLGEFWESNSGIYFKLSEVTFSGETASGWQTGYFPHPIQIAPGDDYEVSYTDPNGHYSYGATTFSSPVDNSPLHVNANAGRYDNDFSTGHPAGTSSDAAYYVDPIFVTSMPSEKSLFDQTFATPAVPHQSDGYNYELGTKFTSDVNARVTAIRMYRTTSYYHSDIVNLWALDGTLLGTGSYSNYGAATGWQEIYLNAPVNLTAGQTYIASYFADSNDYGYTSGFFSSTYTNNSGVYHSPVDAGVYAILGSSSGFPSIASSIHANYWVEPVFDYSLNSTPQVSATVDPSVTFSVATHAGSCNGVAQSAGVATSGTSVALGHLGAGSSVVAAQDLVAASNAGAGFTVYAKNTGVMSDGHGHSIADVGGTNATPVAWPSAGTAAFGYTTNETALGTGTVDRFTNPSARWAALSTAGAEVSYLATPGSHSVCVAYQAAAAATTPAASYTNTVIYTLVPTF